MAETSFPYLRERAYVAATLTHFAVDVLNSSRTLIVALLAISLGLTNTQVGTALIVYNLGSAVAQPLFGWLADRYGPRWIIIGGIGWMIVFFSLGAIAGDWLALIAVSIAGLGSGAVHPAGAKVASQTKDSVRNQATALFFTIGQLGLFIGPVAAGFLLDRFDRPGYIALPIMAILALALDWSAVFKGPEQEDEKATEPIADLPVSTVIIKKAPAWAAIPVAAIVLCTNSFGISIATFTPILFADQGYGQTYIGWAAGLVMLGSAVGVLVGGMLADFWSAKWTVVLGVLIAFVPGILYLPIGDPYRLPLMAVAGFFSGMPHSILVILMQSILPKREAMATGLILGFMFFAGSVGSLIVGRIADSIGLETTLMSVPYILLVGAAAAAFLPRFKHRR